MRRRLAALATALLVLVLPAAAVAAPGPPAAPEWWFDSWRVPALWASGADGHGITIAEIDTGVQASLPELQGKVLPGADFTGNGSDGRTDYDSDDFSHGTAMSSIMVASKGFAGIEGLAPQSRILPIAVPLKGVVRHGTPPGNATSGAIDYAVDHGARIINMSLGGVREESTDGPDPCPGAVQQAVLRAVRRGVLVVAASGNSGDENSPVEEPGVCLGVVSVGAVDRNSDVASFSSRHPYLTVTAPGTDIPSLSRDSAYIGEGTSQATALTSAALALIWSRYPAESARQILTRLLSTATDRGPAGRDPAYGFGVIDPAAAVAAAVPATNAANPVLDAVQPLLSEGPSTGPKPLVAAGAAAPGLGSFSVSPATDRHSPALYLLAGLSLLFLLLAAFAFGGWLRRRKPVAGPAVPGRAVG
ncbi:MAG TPA: S8 family serine peptidase [Jatrophihabitans sp.]|nr:S8 family serine peptidase [Jatrophihabitans sp.]